MGGTEDGLLIAGDRDRRDLAFHPPRVRPNPLLRQALRHRCTRRGGGTLARNLFARRKTRLFGRTLRKRLRLFLATPASRVSIRPTLLSDVRTPRGWAEHL